MKSNFQSNISNRVLVNPCLECTQQFKNINDIKANNFDNVSNLKSEYTLQIV